MLSMLRYLHLLAGRGRREGQWGSWQWSWDQQGQKFAATYKQLHSSKRVVYIHWNVCKIVHSCLVQKVKYISVKYIYPLQVRKKPCDGETEHAFILGSMDCVDVNNNYTNHNPSSFHFSSTTSTTFLPYSSTSDINLTPTIFLLDPSFHSKGSRSQPFYLTAPA